MTPRDWNFDRPTAEQKAADMRNDVAALGYAMQHAGL